MVALFTYGAILARLFILLPLVGRKFLAGGIGEFFNISITGICCAEVVLSLFKLSPIQLPLIILQNWIKIFIVWFIFNRDNLILNHSCYSLLIFCWGLYGFIGYIYWFWKLKNIGKVPRQLVSLFGNSQLVLFPIAGSVEFITIFLSLKYIAAEDESLKKFTQAVLLGYIPTKFYLYKRLIFKIFKIETGKED